MGRRQRDSQSFESEMALGEMSRQSEIHQNKH
jgi:hypothetical protein